VISLQMTRLDFPPAPRRTWFTNLAGAAAIFSGGIGSLFSGFALLMAIGKPYANSSADPLGIFLIFILPPVTLLAGICLLLRQRWARWWLILLSAGALVFGLKGLLFPSALDAAGLSADPSALEAARWIGMLPSLVSAVAGGTLLLGLFSRPVRREFGGAGPAEAMSCPRPD
jgi:hypothetical protein